jgi:formylglycine-generating enzyme required for sulfatase activity
VINLTRKLNGFILCLAVFSTALTSQQAQIAIQSPIAESRVNSFFKHQLRGLLEEAAVNSGSYKVVDRARTDQVLKEQRIQRSGLVSDPEINGLGKMLGVDYILTSELQLSESQKNLSVTCSLINVETAEIIRTANISAENDETAFESACYMLIRKLRLVQIKPEPAAPEKAIQAAARPKTFKNSIGMELGLVPADEFIMGNPKPNELGTDNERPAHRVIISKPYYMGRYLVTQSEWLAVMGNNPSVNKGNNLPVTNVSWDDAREFCRTLSRIEGREYRLPTEAEWEYACKGGQSGSYDPLKDFAWHSGNSRGYIQMVGQKEPNKRGLYDMLGNAGEWCLDWFDVYSARQQTDPTGPAGGRHRVVRGGSFGQREDQCRPTSRSSIHPSEKYNFIGFRIVSETNGQ